MITSKVMRDHCKDDLKASYENISQLKSLTAGFRNDHLLNRTKKLIRIFSMVMNDNQV